MTRLDGATCRLLPFANVQKIKLLRIAEHGDGGKKRLGFGA